MDYRITKIRIKDKSIGTPVNTLLDGIVERMRSSAKIKEVNGIAERVTWSLATEEEDDFKGRIKELDEMPYLVFSAVYGRKGLSDFRQPTGLMLLSVDYGTDGQRMHTVMQAVSQMQETLLAYTQRHACETGRRTRCAHFRAQQQTRHSHSGWRKDYPTG